MQTLTANPIRHYVYLVQCADGTLYTGYAKNVQQRIAVHNTGKGSRYTRSRLPVILLASWHFSTKSAALKREYQIKQLTRQQKLELSRHALLSATALEQTVNRTDSERLPLTEQTYGCFTTPAVQQEASSYTPRIL